MNYNKKKTIENGEGRNVKGEGNMKSSKD